MVRGCMDLSRYPFLKETEIIRHHQTGADGRCKVSAVCDFFQDAAARHAEKIGVGLSFLHAQGLAWVLSRMHVQIFRYPELDEVVEVTTYPSGFERLFAIREFLLRDAGGNELVRASSAWLLLDLKTFRPLRASAELDGEGIAMNADLPEYFPVAGKIPAGVPEDYSPAGEFTCRVLPSEIDLNRHLNNAVYIARMSDALNGMQPAEFEVNFVKSMEAGAEVCYSTWRKGDDFKVIASGDGGDCFIASGRL